MKIYKRKSGGEIECITFRNTLSIHPIQTLNPEE
jgi:hypothetical protein